MDSSVESVLMGTLCAVVAVALIGGCTVTVRGKQTTDMMQACIDQKMEWRDSACLMPPAKTSEVSDG